MSVTCSVFRHLVEEALVGRPDPTRLSVLGFNEHLLGCAACREVLEAEEALEVLLASWPRPELPAALSARLVERLRDMRRLEELLELDSDPAVPVGLTRRVLARVGRDLDARDGGLEGRLDRQLDHWLELAGPVDIPAGLAQRVLRGLAAGEASGPSLLEDVRAWSSRSPARFAAAVVALLGLAGLWRWVQAERRPRPADELEIAMATPPHELLSALPVLENWEVLFAEDDPELATGMDFTAEDEALLEFVDAEEEESNR